MELIHEVRAFKADVVVMNQACDLEHDKVKNVVLWPHLPLSTYKILWEEAMVRGGHQPTTKAWKRTCEAIANGYVWNQTFLNEFDFDDGKNNMEIRDVEFREVFTIPRIFLESLLQQRQAPLPRLLPPYREHLSQAFARFFMRVGLPQAIEKNW